MPIYEYRCVACDSEFEALILNAKTPACPECKSHKVDRLISQFSVSSMETRRLNLRAERQKNSKIKKDKSVADHDLLHHHHH